MFSKNLEQKYLIEKSFGKFPKYFFPKPQLLQQLCNKLFLQFTRRIEKIATFESFSSDTTGFHCGNICDQKDSSENFSEKYETLHNQYINGFVRFEYLEFNKESFRSLISPQ